jgi:hypothetical protein
MRTLILMVALLMTGCTAPTFEQRMAFAGMMLGASQLPAFNRTPYVAQSPQPTQVQIVPNHTGTVCATVNCK